MKTEWDYTNLADAYLKRPDYSNEAVRELIKYAGISSQSTICDVGAGAAHLTLALANYCENIYAVEPNDAMRCNGILRTKDRNNISWYEGTGEHTGMKENSFDLVTFGSSFNVCNRTQALIETARILKENGWFACLWNHRNLNDSLQLEIENVIKRYIPDYKYGVRREDQTGIIVESGLFNEVITFSYEIHHKIKAVDFIEGWKSHGTVYRQARETFDEIMNEIGQIVEKKQKEIIEVPYTTKVWMARVKK